jgi:hypothetical protein
MTNGAKLDPSSTYCANQVIEMILDFGFCAPALLRLLTTGSVAQS